MTDDPMHPFDNALRLRQARRCGARTRSGSTCRSPAVGGKTRCRMHGGATGSGGPLGERNGNYRHGTRTKEAIQAVRLINLLSRLARKS